MNKHKPLTQHIELPCFGIVIDLEDDSGSLYSDLLHDTDREDVDQWGFIGGMDAIESMILAHACAGINVSSPDYIEGIEQTVEAVTNYS